MPLSKKLDRKLQADVDDSDGDEYYEVTDRSTSPSLIETGEGGDALHSNSESESEDGEQFQKQLSKVSFGALAKAQDSLSKQQSSGKRKRGEETSSQQEDKLQALRERLQQIRAEKLGQQGKSSKKAKTTTVAKAAVAESDDEASDGDSTDSDGGPKKRSSKHAPAVQSSKRAVTRKRNAVEVKQRVARDPRFEHIGGPRPDEDALKKRYSFLNDYKASEMAELRKAIKTTKNEDEREVLKRKLMSMDSQKKAQDAKDKQQEIRREHRKKEKQLVKEGKTPFYLKKSEQKKLALVDRFENMKSKQREKVIERRRKKQTAKERKNMPAERRTG